VKLIRLLRDTILGEVCPHLDFQCK